jgi:hypothetical protein
MITLRVNFDSRTQGGRIRMRIQMKVFTVDDNF